mmetsp:Transcript_42876/g.77026  ORF Transcript_42876/g.77026 Transcript_42876/m.77026 type:complete len:224 (+) Transcript_42876:339-1010(+)
MSACSSVRMVRLASSKCSMAPAENKVHSRPSRSILPRRLQYSCTSLMPRISLRRDCTGCSFSVSRRPVSIDDRQSTPSFASSDPSYARFPSSSSSCFTCNWTLRCICSITPHDASDGGMVAEALNLLFTAAKKLCPSKEGCSNCSCPKSSLGVSATCAVVVPDKMPQDGLGSQSCVVWCTVQDDVLGGRRSLTNCLQSRAGDGPCEMATEFIRTEGAWLAEFT